MRRRPTQSATRPTSWSIDTSRWCPPPGGQPDPRTAVSLWRSRARRCRGGGRRQLLLPSQIMAPSLHCRSSQDRWLGSVRTRSRHATYPGRAVCAGQIGATWAARTPKDVPSFPYSERAWAAGASTTATMTTVGLSVLDTRWPSRAVRCRSRCSRTGKKRIISCAKCNGTNTRLRPTGPTRVRRGRIPGRRELRPGSIGHRGRDRPGRTTRPDPHTLQSPQGAHRGDLGAAGGPGSQIG